MRKLRLILVGGARPNFMKLAPLIRSLERNKNYFSYKLVHTGQHYDYAMSKIFFRDLGLPRPDYFLGAKSDSQAAQFAEIMSGFEKVMAKGEQDIVVVVGDVNSTLACAIISVKKDIPVAHIEAGLRSFDDSMPEEINRVLTDRISDFLFTHSLEANANLSKEGIPADKIYFVGNVMIDTLRLFAKKAARLPVLKQFHLKKNNYALLTLHRPSNVDQEDSLGQIMNILKAVATQIPIIFPVHPRTRKRLEAFKFKNSNLWANIRLLEPLGYLDFLALMQNSRFVLTDSGGIQEETTVLGVPCLTLRKNTERPVTVTEGSNTIVGNDSRAIMFQVGQILKGRYKKGAIPALWDGKAADRIIEVFKKSYPR